MEEKTDLRIIKTHKALCDTFLELLSEKPFEDITVNELCDRAMIRRATFYKHFADKYDFFAFFIRQLQEQFISEKESVEQPDEPYTHYLYLFRKCIRFLNQHRRLVQNTLKSNLLPVLLDLFSEEIYRHMLLKLKEDMQNGLSLRMSPEILASFYAGGTIQTLRYWLTGPSSMTEDELVHETELILSSFRP